MSRARRTSALATALATVFALLGSAVVSLTPQTAAAATPATTPATTVTKVVGGLKIPWDLTWVGQLMLFDQRAGGVWSKREGAAPRRIRLPLPHVYAHSEAGMLGMVADPAAATNKNFYTCIAIAHADGKPLGVEVWKWKLTSDTRAVLVRKLVKGIPLVSGRHSGCRLRFRSSQMLYIGTGDAARSANPQNLSSLGGKILRVRSDGVIPASNPFYSRGGNARYVWNYGHRNVQGLIKRPGVSELWSVEHGTDRDDEVNLVTRGQNYGWDPRPGTYNESRPMTDLRRYPHATRARWSSGYPTVATSGGTFIEGKDWGDWNGRLAVAMLKGQGIRIFTVNTKNAITGSTTAFRSYGRIRTVQQGPDGALYFTTSNGSGDGIYRVTTR